MTPGPNDPNRLSAARRHDAVCDRFDDAWKVWIAGAGSGARPDIEEYLASEPEPTGGALFGHLLRNELERRRELRESPTAAEYIRRFPAYERVINELFALTSSHAVPKSDSRRSAETRRRDARFPPGTVLADRYEIVSTPEAGGMGEVYHAEDLELGEPVALKFLREDRAGDPTWIERFRQEVALARKVTHKNVCRVHDLGAHNGTRFLVMEYAAGGSLVAQSRMRPAGRFGPDEVIAYARQLCDGLTAVHECGLLHRDLKPGNVLLSRDGTVKLADFGLAAAAAGLSADEFGAGTVLYMAPEQLSGQDVTARSDLFALGLILYELTTGQRPFPGTTRPELVRQHAEMTPPHPSELVDRLDPALEQVIVRCLSRDPRTRPGSAREVKDALPLPTPKEVANLVPSKPLRPRVAAGLLGAALIGLLVHAAIADRTMAYRQLPEMEMSREILHHRAGELAKIFKRPVAATEKPDTGSNKPTPPHNGFEWDLDLVKDVAHKRPADWHPAEQDTRSPLVYFWYRSSPGYYTPGNRITPADPSMVTEGMVCVLLDQRGRLIEYHAVPARKALQTDSGTRDQRRDHWEQQLLTASELDRVNFVRVPARRRPVVFADDVWSLNEVGGTRKRVDIATCDGFPVYFRVGEPLADSSKERPDRVEGENVAGQGQRRLASGSVTLGILLLAVAAAGPVAYRNWRLGRADLAGALRFVGLYAVSAIIGWALITSHSASPDVERVLLMNIFGIMSFWGLVLLVAYLAVEPYMRRRWPERLSSWNRVLSGRVLDPIVGRDVLLGVLVGVCLAIPLKLVAPLLGTYYLPAPVYEPLTPNAPPGLVSVLIGIALLRTASTFVLLLLFGLVFRREWIAVVAVISIMAYTIRLPIPTFPENAILTWIGATAAAALLTLTAVRFGWLVTLVGAFVAPMLNVMPLTFTPHAWYADATLTVAFVLVALAVYGFFVSLGGQRLFPEDV